MHVPRAKSGAAIFKGVCAPKDPTQWVIKITVNVTIVDKSVK